MIENKALHADKLNNGQSANFNSAANRTHSLLRRRICAINSCLISVRKQFSLRQRRWKKKKWCNTANKPWLLPLFWTLQLLVPSKVSTAKTVFYWSTALSRVHQSWILHGTFECVNFISLSGSSYCSDSIGHKNWFAAKTFVVLNPGVFRLLG